MGESKHQIRIGARLFWNYPGKESCGCWFNGSSKSANKSNKQTIFIQFCAAYLNWRQLNLDQGHRFEMGQSWWGCYLLEAYYRFQIKFNYKLTHFFALCLDLKFIFCRMGEYMDSSSRMRDFDLETWQSKGKPAPLKVKFSILWRTKPPFLSWPIKTILALWTNLRVIFRSLLQIKSENEWQSDCPHRHGLLLRSGDWTDTKLIRNMYWRWRQGKSPHSRGCLLQWFRF